MVFLESHKRPYPLLDGWWIGSRFLPKQAVLFILRVIVVLFVLQGSSLSTWWWYHCRRLERKCWLWHPPVSKGNLCLGPVQQGFQLRTSRLQGGISRLQFHTGASQGLFLGLLFPSSLLGSSGRG